MKKLKIYVIFFLVLALMLFGINFLNGYFSERVEVYVTSKATLYTSSYLEQALLEDVVTNLDLNNLYYAKTNNDDIVTSLHINTNQINNIMAAVNKTVRTNLEEIDETILTLPMGIILGETLFSNMRPNFKIHIRQAGSFSCDVLTTVSEYGINNSLFEIYINVKVRIETIIPLKRGVSDISCRIPIVVQVLQGTVPRYYYNTKNLVPDVIDNE